MKRGVLEVVMVPDSYADVVERLCGEFDGRVPQPMVAQIVRQCRREAVCSGSTADPNPPGLESAARERLLAASTTRGTPSSADETS